MCDVFGSTLIITVHTYGKWLEKLFRFACLHWFVSMNLRVVKFGTL